MTKYETVWLLAVVVLLSAVSSANAKDKVCGECCFSVPAEEAVQWGPKRNFCSESCREVWYDEYTSLRSGCKVCGVHVERPGNIQQSGGITYIVVGGPKWDGFCKPCRAGLKDGSIDEDEITPWEDPQRSCPGDEDEEEEEGWEDDEEEQVEPAVHEDTDSSGGGGGIPPWATPLVLLGGLAFAWKKFLGS